METSAFVDASNLFYGGKKSLGWSIDYEKLLAYLKEKYSVRDVYFFGGVEIHRFPFDYLEHDTVPIEKLEKYLSDLIREKGKYMTDAKLVLLDRHLRRVHFYLKLKMFGYQLVLKPVKTYEDEEGNPIRKANCDVDMAFYLMKHKNTFDRVVVLSGDGDFLPVLKHLRKNNKKVYVLARSKRTAKEIKQFAASEFRDFEYLRELLKRPDEDVI
ncbi:MAG: NYN domain-containing protein [Candidatus Kaiserbacteria bacterium]|nr:NYN domain-containing protein [Candidatus Kaiserbacteria bacterium]